MECYLLRLRGDSSVRGKMIPHCLLRCHIYLWNQTLQLYHICPARFLDTLLEGCERMSQTSLFRGERSLPTRSLSVNLKTGMSSGSAKVSEFNQRDTKISHQMDLWGLSYFSTGHHGVFLVSKAPKMLHTFYRILFFLRKKGQRLCCLSPECCTRAVVCYRPVVTGVVILSPCYGSFSKPLIQI